MSADDDQAEVLGQLVSNLNVLEMELRFFLLEVKDRTSPGTLLGYYGLKKGDKVPLNSFTAYDALRDLIKKYNSIVAQKFQVDERVVELRDAIAHGRVWRHDRGNPYRLMKFSKPEHGQKEVHVTYAADMTGAWLRRKSTEVSRFISCVGWARREHPGGGNP